jgi:hypothetical protein
MPFYNPSYREGAEEARRVAAKMPDPVRKAQWLRIAKGYEAAALAAGESLTVPRGEHEPGTRRSSDH